MLYGDLIRRVQSFEKGVVILEASRLDFIKAVVRLLTGDSMPLMSRAIVHSERETDILTEYCVRHFIEHERESLISLLFSPWSKIFFISKGNRKQMYAKIIGKDTTKDHP